VKVVIKTEDKERLKPININSVLIRPPSLAHVTHTLSCRENYLLLYMNTSVSEVSTLLLPGTEVLELSAAGAGNVALGAQLEASVVRRR
jgi:hypothetical protein